MRPRGFIENWTPRRKRLALLDQVEAIIAEYAIALTIRQIFYRLIARYYYPKTTLAYDNLGELLAMARRARRIPMEAIRDDTFVSYYPLAWDSAEQFMADVRRNVERFRLDRQKGQRRRLVVMCEAGGMAPQLFAVTEQYGIPVLSGGGVRQHQRQTSACRELGVQQSADDGAADRRLRRERLLDVHRAARGHWRLRRGLRWRRRIR